MKRALLFTVLALAMPSVTFGQIGSDKVQEEILGLEKDLSQAIVRNDAEVVGRLLADDWIIIDPDGGIIDKAGFLGVISQVL